MTKESAIDTNESPTHLDLPDPGDTVMAGTRHFTPQALRLFLDCSRHIALGLAHVLSHWWQREDPVRSCCAENTLLQVELDKQRKITEIMRKRLERFPARQRKHYTPEERFEILVLMRSHGLSRKEIARTFVIDQQTISRWEREALAEHDSRTIGTLVRANPPLRSYDDVVKQLVHKLASLKIGGSQKIAQMLARSGLKISRETVRRYRRAPRPPRPIPSTGETARVLRAKYANHIWLTDLTEVRGFLGLFTYKLCVVLDLFSRFPLSFGVFRSEPSAADVLQVLDRAIKKHGRPRHFVSDQGTQFTSHLFRDTLEALSIRQRFGAIGQYGSIAIIERFWRTIKELLSIRIYPPLSQAHLESRLELTLASYAALRPHQGLDGATPAEIYFDKEPAANHAKPPPRAHDRDPTKPSTLQFEITYLDNERLLPVLVPTTRAA